MANYASIERHLAIGRGHAGRVLGQPWSLYRPISPTATNFFDINNVVFTNLHIYRRLITNKTFLEVPPTRGDMFYELIGDPTQWILGDIFLLTDTLYGAGKSYVDYTTQEIVAHAFAYHMPVRKYIGVRIDRLAQIYRATPNPATNNNNTVPYFNTALDNAQPLILREKEFFFGTEAAVDTTGTIASFIPIGLQESTRVTGRLYKELPETLPVDRWIMYIPPLFGYDPREGDRIVTQDGTRYVIVSPYEQEVTLVGNLLYVERMFDRT